MEEFTSIRKEIVNFYPTWREYCFLAEAEKGKQHIPKSAKIEDYGVVYNQEGEAINMRELRNEMESAKTAIVSQSPLFAPYVHNFTPIYTWLVPTMATDGIRLFVNPSFAKKLSWHQKIFVLIHEIMHCVLIHMERLKGRDGTLFNIAGDYEVNDLIVDTINDFDEKFMTEIGGLYDKQYLNWPVEKIYEEVKKNMPSMPPNSLSQGNQGSNQGGEPQDCPDCGGTGKVPPGGTPPQPGEGQGEGAPGEGAPGEGEGEGSPQPGPGQGGPKPGDTCPSCGGSGKQPGQPGDIGGAGSSGGGSIYERMKDYDPAGTGGVIPEDLGKKIAEESGYKGDEMGEDISAKDKWNVESGKLMDEMEKSSKHHGSGKGGALLKTLQRIHKGDVNWKRLFRKYVSNALSPEKYWRLGSKKHLGKEYLKHAERQKSDAIRHIVVMIDVSGSMSHKVLEKILGEINGIIFAKKVKKITVCFFDDGVDEKSVQVIERHGNKPFIPKDVSGGGGTSFQKSLDWIEKTLKNKISLCVFFTDGYAPIPTKPPYASKFIWVIYDNPGFENPFGKMINLSEQE
jgi:predicted metal-dependent peptidase